MKKLPKVGTRVRVLWRDIVGFTNVPMREALPADVWTEGKLVKAETEFLVIATSQYIDDEPADAKLGDYVAIPRGTVVRVSRL